MNSLHPKLKFEIEKLEKHPMASHCHYSISNPPSPKTAEAPSSFTKKAAKKPLFVHHQSAIPKKSKINFIRNEWKRIEDRCSTQTSIKHRNVFDDILRINGYPEDSTEQTKHPQSHQRNSPPPKVDWSYLKIPYICERLSHKITNIFRKEGIPVRVAHKSYTLRRADSLAQHHGAYMHQEQLPPPPKPNCAFSGMPFTRSPVTIAINTTSGATFHPRSCKRTSQ